MAKWALRGFERTTVLAPAASVTLTFSLGARDLSTVMADGSRVVAKGTYTVSIGGGSPLDPRAPAKPVQGSVTLPGGRVRGNR